MSGWRRNVPFPTDQEAKVLEAVLRNADRGVEYSTRTGLRAPTKLKTHIIGDTLSNLQKRGFVEKPGGVKGRYAPTKAARELRPWLKLMKKRRLSANATAVLRELARQFRVLGEFPLVPMLQEALGGMSNQFVYRNLKELEKRGFVSRVPGQQAWAGASVHGLETLPGAEPAVGPSGQHSAPPVKPNGHVAPAAPAGFVPAMPEPPPLREAAPATFTDMLLQELATKLAAQIDPAALTARLGVQPPASQPEPQPAAPAAPQGTVLILTLEVDGELSQTRLNIASPDVRLVGVSMEEA